MKITYQICKRVFENKTTKKQGIQALIERQNMNKNSAIIVINVFLKLMNGERFTRTLNNPLFEYFLEKISSDYSVEQLQRVLAALDLHINYIGNKGNPKIRLKLIRNIYNEKLRGLSFENNIENLNDEIQQNEIISYLKDSKSKQDIIDELNKLTPEEPEFIIINNKAYKRNNKTIAQIKFVRDFKCQICQIFIPKSNGGKYIEAAHIIPKHKKGQELPENIILLCPNHHKEFDLGNPYIKKHTKSIIEFVLNEKNYAINLAFK